MQRRPSRHKLFPSIVQDSCLGQGVQREKKKIAIVTPDLTGPIKNGGVGTAYAALSELLAADGHEVTIIFANGYSDDEKAFHLWQREYKNRGITLLSLREPLVTLDNLHPTRSSHAVYEMLKGMNFDIVHFPDLYGLGYISQQAKRQGLAFRNTLFCVILHGPQAWSFSTNAQLPHKIDAVQMFHFERKSVEWADVLVSPSQYGLQWALEQGWKLPERTFVEQYIVPNSARAAYEGRRKNFHEIVFFGRLETRKGIELFCDAIEELPEALLKKIKVTFLGRFGIVGGTAAEIFLKQRTKRWTWRYEWITDLNQEEALGYLRETRPLVVIASRSETLGFTTIECIEGGIPFLASRIPAFEELVAEDSQHSVFFESSAEELAEKIVSANRDGIAPARMKVSKSVTDARWRRWHRELPLLNVPEWQSPSRPLVSVCITHRNRPQFLRDAIRSVEAQTYQNFELLLVDDASDTAEAIALVEELSAEFSAKGWKVLRQKEVRGPGAGRNWAVEEARGEYILLMDDDNVAKEHELETLVNVAQRTSADIVTTGFDRFKGRRPALKKDGSTLRFIGVGDDLNQAVFINVFGDTNALYRKAAYTELGGYSDQRGVGFEDYDFFLRAVMKGYRLEACPEALFWYREHDAQYTTETDAFRTLLFRMRNFADFFGQDIRPLLSLLHANNFQYGYTTPSANPRAPLIHPQRTDYYSGALADLKLVARGSRDSLKAENTKIAWWSDAAKVSLAKRDSALLFSFPKARKAKGAQHMLCLTVSVMEPAFLHLDYQREGEMGRSSKRVRPGKNELHFRLSGADLAKPIRLSANSGLDVLLLQKSELFRVEENADLN